VNSSTSAMCKYASQTHSRAVQVSAVISPVSMDCSSAGRCHSPIVQKVHQQSQGHSSELPRSPVLMSPRWTLATDCTVTSTSTIYNTQDNPQVSWSLCLGGWKCKKH